MQRRQLVTGPTDPPWIGRGDERGGLIGPPRFVPGSVPQTRRRASGRGRGGRWWMTGPRRHEVSCSDNRPRSRLHAGRAARRHHPDAARPRGRLHAPAGRHPHRAGHPGLEHVDPAGSDRRRADGPRAPADLRRQLRVGEQPQRRHLHPDRLELLRRRRDDGRPVPRRLQLHGQLVHPHGQRAEWGQCVDGDRDHRPGEHERLHLLALFDLADVDLTDAQPQRPSSDDAITVSDGVALRNVTGAVGT